MDGHPVAPVTWPGEELSVEVVSALREEPSRSVCHDGSCTGDRKTMMQTTAARQTPATPSSLPLCSMAPRRTVRKKPLNRKNSAMLTELFTSPAYQKPPRADSGPGLRSSFNGAASMFGSLLTAPVAYHLTTAIASGNFGIY